MSSEYTYDSWEEVDVTTEELHEAYTHVRTVSKTVSEIGGTVNEIFVTEKEDTPYSIGFQFEYLREQLQYFTRIEDRAGGIIYGKYYLLTDFILGSTHPLLGNSVPDEGVSEYIEQTKNKLSEKETIAILKKNRSVSIQQVEYGVETILSGAAIPIEPRFNRLDDEFLSFTITSSVWPEEISTQTLYYKLTVFANINRGLRTTIASPYLSNGIQIPSNQSEIQSQNPTSSQRSGTSPGFQ